MTYKTRNESGGVHPKAKGVIATVLYKFQGGEARGWEEAEGTKTGQTEEVAFRKTLPHPAQQNQAGLPLTYTTYTPTTEILAVVTAREDHTVVQILITGSLKPKQPR